MKKFPIKRWEIEDNPEYFIVIEPNNNSEGNLVFYITNKNDENPLNLYELEFLLEEVEVNSKGKEISWTEALLVQFKNQDVWMIEKNIKYNFSYGGHKIMVIKPFTKFEEINIIEDFEEEENSDESDED